MKLGFDFDFEQKEAVRRSENYIRSAYNPYPIPENEPHAQKTIPENEPHAQKTIPENEPHAQKTIPENEPHAQKTIPENEPNAQNTIPKIPVDMWEKVDAEWDAIFSILKVSHICEEMAKHYRNIGDTDMENCYLHEANYAKEKAYLFYILTHK